MPQWQVYGWREGCNYENCIQPIFVVGPSKNSALGKYLIYSNINKNHSKSIFKKWAVDVMCDCDPTAAFC
ncbi:hypothetical protein XACJJ10_1290018 [Xanthomonas citri pv. citri]|nr:hypothetical protein XACB100_1500003 [Xanthomonas citri pv. citri]CEI34417.1 hypothetical protein XACJJ10_1290018 [Xanthomonas citri pv. citri]